MHPYALIGLTGKARAGKDSLAAALVARHGFVRVAFADPLRAAALALDPLVGRPAIPGNLRPTHDLRLSEVVEALGWEGAKVQCPEVRRVLQHFGTGIRALDRGFWVRQAMKAVDEAGGPVVVTDVRFPNEVATVLAHGGLMVRVIRPGMVSTDTHESETALDGIAVDATVTNCGPLSALDSAADHIAERAAERYHEVFGA